MGSLLSVVVTALVFIVVRRRYTSVRSTPTARLLKEHLGVIAVVTVLGVVAIAAGNDLAGLEIATILTAGIAASVGVLIAAILPSPNRNNQELLDAVKAGDVQRSRLAMFNGASVAIGETDGTRRSLLAIAIQSKNDRLIEELLTFNAPVTHDAALAAVHSDRDCLAQLLEKNPALDVDPLLVAACGIAGERAVSVLLEHGARFGPVHFMAASTAGRVELCEMMIREHSVDMKQIGNAALASALAAGRLDQVHWLLRHGAVVDANAPRHVSPVGIGVELGDTLLVKRLFDAGGSPDSIDRTGDPVLVSAIARRNLAMVDFLIQCSASVDVKDGNGRPIVWRAAMAGGPFLARVLNAGADINARDRSGQTVLEDFLSVGFIEIDTVDRILALGGVAPLPNSLTGKKIEQRRKERRMSSRAQ